MAQITHRSEDGRMVQIVTPAELGRVLDAEGSDHSRPADFGPEDEWDCDDDSDTIECHDRCSGERFTVPDDDDIEESIEAYIREGIDADTGAVDYDVTTSDGRSFSGTIEPD